MQPPLNQFADRQVYTHKDLKDQSFSQLAHSDGWVLAVLGTAGYQSAFVGLVYGSTSADEQTTSCVFASARTQQLELSGGKKAGALYHVPIMGSFCMPVRQGEVWRVTLSANPELAPVPDLTFSWTPARANTSNALAMQAGLAYQEFHQMVSSGALRGSVMSAAQVTIDTRVHDLTRILGQATGISEDEQARTRFVRDLQKIVCSAHLPNEANNKELRAEDVQALIATFAEITNHHFDPDQQSLLDVGIRALVQINENAENRNDLSLIQRNIGLFLDNMQRVLLRDFSSAQRRLLTRALVRLVGDGSHA